MTSVTAEMTPPAEPPGPTPVASANLNHARTLRVLSQVGAHGVTYRELNTRLNWEHGTSSSALSHLHETGRIARLVEQRGRCFVYVLPEYVGDRPTGQHAAWAKAARDQREREVVREFEVAVRRHHEQQAMGVVLTMSQARRVLSVLRRMHPEEP